MTDHAEPPMSASDRSPNDPAWFEFVDVGDVLRAGSGDLRVVREVTRWRRLRRGVIERGVGSLRGVLFVIRHASWTRRANTCLTASDLKTRGFTHTGVRVPLTADIDQCIAEDIRLLHMPGVSPRLLYPKHVRGIP